jgi:hypothetical protein
MLDQAAVLASEALSRDEAITLLCAEEDDTFFDALKAQVLYERNKPIASVLEDDRILTRLCALPDLPFIEAVLTLAMESYYGLTLLYETPIMARVAAISYANRKGVFFKVAKAQVSGFDAPDYRRELHPYVLRYSAQQGVGARFAPITAAELLAMEFPPLLWVVDEMLPAGLTLFTGRGKDGKSLLVWNLCLAVATGGLALGRYHALRGDVLYLDLEDGGRRAQKRLQEALDVLPDQRTIPDTFQLITWESPRVGEGLEEQLTAWLDTHPNARLIAIDILEKIRPRRRAGGSVYEDDYQALASLQRLAQERNVAILVVHHSNKSKPEDFRDTASGSMGLIGACDTFWGLARVAGQADATLRITGREVSEQELAMQFDDGFWTVLGEKSEVQRSQATREILDALRQTQGPLSVKQLATALNVPENTMRVRLCRMTRRGEVNGVGDGLYGLPSPTPGSLTYGIPVEETAVIPVMEDAPPPAPVPEVQEVTEPVEIETEADPMPAVEEDRQETIETAPVSEAGITPITASNGSMNGLHHSSHRHGTPPCAHVWKTEGRQSRCARCGVCCPIKA